MSSAVNSGFAEFSDVLRDAFARAESLVAHAAAEVVAIHSLWPGDSPRLAGESAGHARALAVAEERLPPIAVRRTTRRGIDGAHRVRAAVLRGKSSIEARFFEGDEEEAFPVAVKVNAARSCRCRSPTGRPPRSGSFTRTRSGRTG